MNPNAQDASCIDDSLRWLANCACNGDNGVKGDKGEMGKRCKRLNVCDTLAEIMKAMIPVTTTNLTVRSRCAADNPKEDSERATYVIH